MDIINSLKLWGKSGKVRIAQRMAYRSEFFISLVAMLMLEMLGPLFAFIIYTNTNGFPGWTFHEILLVQGILLVVRGFSFFSFAGIIWNSNIKLQKGEFDLLLLKPRNILLAFICDSFDPEDMAKFFGGVFITIYALFNIENVTILGLFLMLIFIIIGIIFYFALSLFASSFIFRFVRSFQIYNLIDILELFGRNPKSIYPMGVKAVLVSIIPIFVLGIFPVKALLLEFEYSMIVTIVFVFLLLFLGIKIWYGTIKNYSSAGG